MKFADRSVRPEVNARQRDAPSGALVFVMANDRKPLKVEDALNETCPWSGKPIKANALTLWDGSVVGFSRRDYRDKFDKAIAHFEDARMKKQARILTL